MSRTVIPVGADHRGFALKASVVAWLAAHGHQPMDLGTHSADRCDALDYAKRLAAEIKAGHAATGVLICGSGQAMAMAANRHQALRAALCASPEMARTTREHNDANVLVLGADFTPPEIVLECLATFLSTAFLGGRYADRRDALTALGGL